MNSQQAFELVAAACEESHKAFRAAEARGELKIAIDKYHDGLYQSVKDVAEYMRKHQDEP